MFTCSLYRIESTGHTTISLIHSLIRSFEFSNYLMMLSLLISIIVIRFQSLVIQCIYLILNHLTFRCSSLKYLKRSLIVIYGRDHLLLLRLVLLNLPNHLNGIFIIFMIEKRVIMISCRCFI